MKKILVVVVGIALFLTTNIAFAKAEKEVEVNVSTAVHSTYLWRGFDVYETGSKATAHFDPSFQPTLEASVDNFSFGLWGAFALADRARLGGVDELNLYSGYDVNTRLGALGFGTIFYAFPNNYSGNNVEGYVSFGITELPLTPTVATYFSDASVLPYTTITLSHTFEPTDDVTVGMELVTGLSDRSHLTFTIPIAMRLFNRSTFVFGPSVMYKIYENASDRLVTSFGVSLNHTI